ncbi:MAG TPA: SRPBCC domain-containing protein [Candidatus Thermoplasmatota archaeon]|nr:SRPBCC domain-containing protein [Candidatus Thermoplasmatota archaeon]
MKQNTQTSKTPILTIERAFNATPEKLWSYWTDPKKYAKWLNPAPLDLVIHEFDVRVGGKVRFDMPQPDGNKNSQHGVFHKLDPYNEIVTGEPDKSFLIQVLFQPMTAKMTRMVVNVTGLSAEWRAPATQGWNQGLDKLEKLIGGGPALPKVTGANTGFTIERTFKASPEKVWDMWTTKAGLEKWWVLAAKDMGMEMTIAKLDVRVGGKYEFIMTDPKVKLRNYGTYTEVKPRKRLAWTWTFDIFLAPGEKPYDVPISVDLEPVSGGTKLTFKQGPLASAEHTEGSRQGVTANFEKLRQALGG